MEIISEASRRLPAELKDRHPEIDWVAVAAAGNVYRHEYEAVDEGIIWRTVAQAWPIEP
ncbi:MAG: HepT-like ribonuclease domain-containing protein [Acidobacteriota bacterium]